MITSNEAKLAVMQILEETENLGRLRREVVARLVGVSNSKLQKLLSEADTPYQYLLDMERMARIERLSQSDRLSTVSDAIAAAGLGSWNAYNAFCQRHGIGG